MKILVSPYSGCGRRFFHKIDEIDGKKVLFYYEEDYHVDVPNFDVRCKYTDRHEKRILTYNHFPNLTEKDEMDGILDCMLPRGPLIWEQFHHITYKVHFDNRFVVTPIPEKFRRESKKLLDDNPEVILYEEESI